MTYVYCALNFNVESDHKRLPVDVRVTKRISEVSLRHSCKKKSCGYLWASLVKRNCSVRFQSNASSDFKTSFCVRFSRISCKKYVFNLIRKLKLKQKEDSYPVSTGNEEFLFPALLQVK